MITITMKNSGGELGTYSASVMAGELGELNDGDVFIVEGYEEEEQ